jgi:hypothetical protein
MTSAAGNRPPAAGKSTASAVKNFFHRMRLRNPSFSCTFAQNLPKICPKLARNL